MSHLDMIVIQPFSERMAVSLMLPRFFLLDTIRGMHARQEVVILCTI